MRAHRMLHRRCLGGALAALFWFQPHRVWAEAAGDAGWGPSPLSVMLAVALVALLPFLFVSMTSFAKMSVVLGVLRQALGTPQVPSGAVISGLAVVLSLHVMAPVWAEIEREVMPRLQQAPNGEPGQGSQAETLVQAALAAREPLRTFLRQNASERNVEFFRRMAEQRAAPSAERPRAEAFLVLAPAFVLTELAEGFLVGFLLFVPFFIIDIVVANVLMSLGMHMLAPTTMSLPLKLLLFVMVDGWNLVCQGLVTGYS